MTTNRTADTATVASDPGAWGHTLGTLGFTSCHEVDDGWHGRHLISDRAEDDVRVVTWPDDGYRVEVLAWDAGTRPGVHLLAWKADFDGSSPLDVVAGAIAIAVGKLAVR